MANQIKTAKKIVQAVLADVCDRRGWRQEWYSFDPDVQTEIKDTLTKLILKELQDANISSK